MVSKNSRIAYILLALGFLIRLAYVQFINPISSSIYSDMSNYVQVADLIKNGEWRASHFFQPIGFPYFILILKSFTPNWMTLLEWIQIVAGTISLWFFWQTAKASFGEKVGLISLAFGSVHLPWLAFTGLALAENLFIFLLSFLAWITLKLVQEGKAVFAVTWVVVFFTAFLAKGTHVFYGPLFVLGFFYYYRKTAIKNILIICLIMSAGLLSHGLFTKSKIGHFQISASAGGLNFVEGKCPQKNNADSAGYSWLSPLYHQLDMNQLKRWDRPFTDSNYFMNEGLNCIIKNPFVLVQSLEGIPFLFFGNTLWPANQSRIAHQMRLYELFFSCFCLVGLIVYFRFLKNSPNKQEEILVWVLPILSVMICVYIFKSEIRFRIPFDVWLIPVAVKGWDLLFKAKVA
jgi:hypothetical protein